MTDCASPTDTLAHDPPSPYFVHELSTPGVDTDGRQRSAVHTAAAERLARLGRWEQAYDHMRAAVRLLLEPARPGD